MDSTKSGKELAEMLFKEFKLLLNDKETIRSVATIKHTQTQEIFGKWSKKYPCLFH